MTPIQKAELLALGGTLTRHQVKGDEDKIVARLKEIIRDSKMVIRQFKEDK